MKNQRPKYEYCYYMFIKNLIFFSKKGDSGGPLICGTKEKEKIYGVISWGIFCAENGGIYARVAYHRQWIDEEIKVTRFHIILSR